MHFDQFCHDMDGVPVESLSIVIMPDCILIKIIKYYLIFISSFKTGIKIKKKWYFSKFISNSNISMTKNCDTQIISHMLNIMGRSGGHNRVSLTAIK